MLRGTGTVRDAGVEPQREESLIRGAKVSGREWNSVSQCMTCPSTMGSLSPSTGTFWNAFTCYFSSLASQKLFGERPSITPFG